LLYATFSGKSTNYESSLTNVEHRSTKPNEVFE